MVNPREIPNIVAKNLRYLRNVKHLTPEQIACKASVMVKVVQDAEKGIRPCRLDLQRIARVLGQTEESLSDPDLSNHAAQMERQKQARWKKGNFKGALDLMEYQRRGLR